MWRCDRFGAVVRFVGGCVLVLAASPGWAKTQCTKPGGTANLNAGAIEGTLIVLGGRPASQALVTAEWPSASHAPPAKSSESTTADSGGHYVLCGLPSDAAIELRIAFDSREWLVPNVVTRPDAAVRRDLRLHPAPGELIRVSGARQSRPGVLKGYVYDESGAPVARVSVRLPGSSYKDLTDDNGRFLIPEVLAGRYSVEARALGFSPLEASVSLRAGDTAKVNFILNRSVTTLSKVLTIGEPTAFERTSGFGERRRRGIGLSFDRASIERRGSQRITDLVRGAPGFTLQPVFNRWGQSYDIRMDRVVVAGGNACQIDYYLNGNQYTPSSAGIDHDFPAQQVEAVEVFRPSEVPAQFGGQRSRCGVIVIWTRYHAYDIP